MLSVARPSPVYLVVRLSSEAEKRVGDRVDAAEGARVETDDPLVDLLDAEPERGADAEESAHDRQDVHHVADPAVHLRACVARV